MCFFQYSFISYAQLDGTRVDALHPFSFKGQDALIFSVLRDSRLGKRSGEMSELYWLTDEQLAKLSPFFPKSYGKPCVDDKRVQSGIIFINRNGLRWRDALQGV